MGLHFAAFLKKHAKLYEVGTDTGALYNSWNWLEFCSFWWYLIELSICIVVQEWEGRKQSWKSLILRTSLYLNPKERYCYKNYTTWFSSLYKVESMWIVPRGGGIGQSQFLWWSVPQLIHQTMSKQYRKASTYACHSCISLTSSVSNLTSVLRSLGQFKVPRSPRERGTPHRKNIR